MPLYRPEDYWREYGRYRRFCASQDQWYNVTYSSSCTLPTRYTTNTWTTSDNWWPTINITASSNTSTATWHYLTYNGNPLTYDHIETPVYRTAEERAQDAAYALTQEQRRQRQHEQEQRAAERIVAHSRAIDLLVSLLPDDQVQRYRNQGVFEILGSHGTLYRIREGVSGNIEWIKPGGEVGGVLCAHPSMRDGWLPTPDVLASQLLAITTDEREFVRIANVHRGERPPVENLARRALQRVIAA